MAIIGSPPDGIWPILRVLVIEGEPGIGKTGLLRCASELARRRGFMVLTARGFELERDLAYGVVRQLLERTLRRMRQRDRDAAFAGAARHARLVLEVDSDRGPADGQRPRDPTFAARHGLHWLCANLAARSPLALVVDDLQWTDLPSARLLEYLGARNEPYLALRLEAALTGTALLHVATAPFRPRTAPSSSGGW